jgi:hypothetical protein
VTGPVYIVLKRGGKWSLCIRRYVLSFMYSFVWWSLCFEPCIVPEKIDKFYSCIRSCTCYLIDRCWFYWRLSHICLTELMFWTVHCTWENCKFVLSYLFVYLLQLKDAEEGCLLNEMVRGTRRGEGTDDGSGRTPAQLNDSSNWNWTVVNFN